MDYSQNVRDFWQQNLKPIIEDFLTKTSKATLTKENTTSKPYTFCEIVFIVLWWRACRYSELQLKNDAGVIEQLQILLRQLYYKPESEHSDSATATTARLDKLCRTIKTMHTELKNFEEGNPDATKLSYTFKENGRRFFGVLLGSYLEQFVHEYYKKNHNREHVYTQYIENFANDVQLQFSDTTKEGNELAFFERAEIFFAELGRGSTIITEALQFINNRDAENTRKWYATTEQKSFAQQPSEVAASMLIAPSSNPYIVAAQLSAFVLRD